MIYILRHGQTEWNRDLRVQGQAESVLTDLGRRHAAAQGRLLAPILDADPDMPLYASPLQRTRQTAEIALGPNLPRTVWEPRLMEVHMGVWQGHLRRDLAPKYPIFTDGTSDFERCVSAPGGEDFDQLLIRVKSFADVLSSPAVVVTHGITGAVLRGLLCGLDRDGMGALDLAQGVVYCVADGVERVLSEPPVPKA